LQNVAEMEAMLSRVRRREMEALFDQKEAQAGGAWPVALDYRIVDGTIYPVDHPGDLPDPPPGCSVVPSPWVAPLAEPAAFLQFARLASHGEPSVDRIKGWLRRYGLIHRREPESPLPNVMLEDETGRAYVGLNQRPITVGAFRKEAREAYLLLRLYEMLRGGEWPALRERLKEDSPEPYRASYPARPHGPFVQEVHFGQLSLFYEGEMFGGHDVRAIFESDHLMECCWWALGENIDRRTEGVKHNLSLPAGGFVVNCPDLLSALYWQFACLVAGKRRVGVCDVCGVLFEQRRRDRRTCSNTCRSQKSRSRKEKEIQDR